MPGFGDARRLVRLAVVALALIATFALLPPAAVRATNTIYTVGSNLDTGMVADRYGNPTPNVSVTFAAPVNGASDHFAGGGASATVNTDATGVATAPPLTANDTAGGP